MNIKIRRTEAKLMKVRRPGPKDRLCEGGNKKCPKMYKLRV